MTRKVAGCPFFCNPEGFTVNVSLFFCHPEGFSPKGLILLGFFAIAQNDTFLCHPEAKPKGLLRGFFPFASLRVRMTE